MKKVIRIGIGVTTVLTLTHSISLAAFANPTLGDIDLAKAKESAIILEVSSESFSTRFVEDSNLPAGIEVTTQEGVDGERSFFKAFEKIRGSNGLFTTVPVLYEEVTKLPTEEVIRRGTNEAVIDGVSEKTREIEKAKAQKIESEKAEAERFEAEKARADEEKASREREEKERKERAEKEADDTAKALEAKQALESGKALEIEANNEASRQSPQTPVEVRVPVSESPDKQSTQSITTSGVTSPEENRAYAKSILSDSEFRCIDELAMRESEWKTTAENTESGAYGVAQSLPGSKMAANGDDWRTNGRTQVDWMIDYMNKRYGGACNALQHSHSIGWY